MSGGTGAPVGSQCPQPKNWPSARRTSSFGTRISSIRIFATSSWFTRAAEIAFSMSFSETRPLSTSAPNLDGLLVRAARCWL